MDPMKTMSDLVKMGLKFSKSVIKVVLYCTSPLDVDGKLL